MRFRLQPSSTGSTGQSAKGGRVARLTVTAFLIGVVSVLTLAFGAGAAGAAPLSTIGVVGKCCGEAVGEYFYANGLDVNRSNGDLYLLDPNNSRVLVFDQNGIYKFSFGSEGTGGGQLGKYSSVGLSIDQNNGDVYVSESGGPFANNRISKFTEDGDFILTFGRRVNETTLGDVCTKASGNVCQSGAYEGEHAIVNTIASVDPATGNVFVPENGSTIDIYRPDGKFLETFPAPGVGIQVSIDHEIVYQVTSTGFKTYTTAGAPLGEVAVPSFTEFSPAGMAPGPGTEKPEETHLYVLMSSQVTGKWEVGEFNTAGKLLLEHGIGMPQAAQGAIAVDPSIPHIYIGNYPTEFGGTTIILGVPETLPSSVTKPVTDVTTNSATLHGTVNPNGTTLDTSWHFEYRRIANGNFIPIPQEEVNVGHGTSPIDVSQAVTGLDPNFVYEFRLVASREFGGGSTTSSVATFKTGYEPPVFSRTTPAHITDTEATLQSLIDARHAATTYYFEYGPTDAYGTKTPIGEEGDAGGELGPTGVFERLTGLQPGTEYHFRLVAKNAAGTTTGSDNVFNTYTTADEQWPARDIELVNDPEDGNQAVAMGLREPVSPDGTEVLWTTPAGAPKSTTGYFQLFLSERNVNSPYGWETKPIGVPASEQVGGGDNAYFPRAASRDFSTFMMSTAAGFITSNFDHTYTRITRDGGQTILADTGNQELNSIAISDDGSYLNYFNPLTGELISYHDGIETPLPLPSCGYESPGDRYPNVSLNNLARTFVQSNGDEPACESPGIFMIDREADTVTNIAPGGHFVRTNVDGTKVIFHKEDKIYEWTEAGGVHCLGCAEMPPVAAGRGFENLAVSEDLSHVYFWIRHIGPRERSCEAGSIYVVHHDAVDFVADADSNVCYGDAEMDLTPDGTTLLFPSTRTGTTADDTGAVLNQEGSEENNSAQLYRYDDDTGYTECVSCKGTKGPADGGLWGSILNSTYTVSADGSTIAYSHEATLVPEDINKAMDVYEWHNGVTRLITSGEVEFHNTLFSAPRLWGASTDGRTVVFSAGGTRLTGNERNHFGNAYASVVGGPGFPPPNPPAHCVEDSCQGPLLPPPPLDFQGSSAFHGPGSPVPHRGSGNGNGKSKHKKKHRKKRQKRHNSTRKHG